MFLVLKRLHSLWYLILILSSLCLIATIVFYSLNIGDVQGFIHLIPLFASVITVIIFAYGLWGKANPYLMPTSSPRSNPCTRSVRHFGTSLLTLLWLISTVNYAVINVLVERLFSGLTLLIAILIVVESISSSRLGKEQRRILKEEERRVELERVARDSGSTLVAAATNFRKYGKKHNNDSRDSGLGSLGDYDSSNDNNSSGENELTGVEIVRPEAIDPATVIYNQQILFESAQRHYHQQYQQYLIHQPRDGNASGGNNGGDGEPQEGKYDDILLESSYKFEIPMDEPLYNNSTGKPSSSALAAGPSSPQSSSSPSSNEKLHLPSAPPAPSPTYSYPSLPRALQGPATPTSFSPSLSSPPSSSTATTKEVQRKSLLKNEISPVGIQLMAETNPFRDQDYQAVTELSATAPPYEPSLTWSSSFAPPKFGEQNSGNDHGSPLSDDVVHSSYNHRTIVPTPTTTLTTTTIAATATTRSGVTKAQP
ncbi:hypothetical protein K457DRAFT_135340 [Linnemannia elongata AG-77]|uniref:Uncharacterized protein n=1 Tax=Linnemannia elongata AG-77 TaxID=1314771 RepID=A0A197K5H5_9FUNG|nr:hypothetical protein K457DRAFT_135340 [Linnemannia elongata AG-77]